MAGFLASLIDVGTPRRPRGAVRHVLMAAGAGLVGTALYANFAVFVQPWTMAALFMAAMFVFIFLIVPAGRRSDPERPSMLDWLLAAASLAVLAHFAVSAGRIIDRIPLIDRLTTVDMVLGVAFTLLALEATRRTTGLGLTLVVLLFMAYNFFGHHLGGLLHHAPIDVETFLDSTVYGIYGINGVVARVAASYALVFVLFGVVLTRSGGGEFFFKMAASLTGRAAGGPAKVAVISSGMYGMVSGNAVSDVMTTGSVTIPIMKRLGYPPALAAGVETAASAGGALMPPVMGAAAFVMVEYTGIPYGDIALAALGPALLYYLAVFGQVHFRARVAGLAPLDGADIPRPLAALRDGGLFFVPLAAMVIALAQGYTAIYSALVATIAVLLVAALRPATRIGLRGMYECLAETASRMVVITGACAAAGLVIGGITLTGLAQKTSHLVALATGGNLLLALLLAGVVTLVLGMGMPTVSAYILAAVLVGPLLASLGVDLLPAHMFLLYFATLSALTPPVAVAAYAAAAIANSNPLLTAGLAVRLGVVAFIIPFGFVYAPELLLVGEWHRVTLALGSAAVGTVLGAAAIEGYFYRPLGRPARAVLGLAGLYLLVPLAPSLTLAGLAAVLPAWLVIHLRSRSLAPS